MMRALSFVLSTGILVAATAAPAAAKKAPPPDVPGGQLMVLATDGKAPAKPLEFPLEHTSVKAEISGFVARVEVAQTYHNPFDERIEAVYTFPLPDDAAVDQMEMKIGDRVISGQIKKKAEAKEIYERAKSRGQTAALLDQERPNIFTQQVANIQPGQRIDVRIRYVAILKYDGGGYEFNFPTTVGPRYIPGDAVADADKITPPVLKPGERSGHDIDIEVRMDAGLAIQSLHSPSHSIRTSHKAGSGLATVSLAPADRIPNKDFILRYEVAGKRPESAVLTHRDPAKRNGYVTLMIQPQAAPKPTEITPVEMIYVVDTSGSMRGAPMEKAKELMRRSIREMNPRDSFYIMDFDDKVSAMSKRPLPNTKANREKALRYVDGFRGSGGTRMLSAIEASLTMPERGDRMRIIVFITDGYIGNEKDILARIQKNLGDARLFVFGVGSSVNHFLLDRMALEGRGFKQYVRPDENTAKVVTTFYDRIANPLLTDVRIDWGGLDVRDVYPKKIPDLFSAQPVFVHARFKKPGKATVVVRGRVAGKKYAQRIAVTLPKASADNGALGSVWARQKIEDLERQQYRGEDEKIAGQITEVALSHGLMSRYTSFVAVEERMVDDGKGPPRKVVQPVELPEGVSYEGVFGNGNVAAGAAPTPKPSRAYGRYSMKKSAPQVRGRAYGLSGRGVGGGGSSYDAPSASADVEESPMPEPRRERKVAVRVDVKTTAAAADERVLRRQLPRIRAMATRIARSQGGLSGAMTVEIAIDETGKVLGVSVTRDGVRVKAMTTALNVLLRRAAFAPAKTKRTITATFAFR